MSDVMHLEAGCDTQTFELAVCKKFVSIQVGEATVRSVCKTTTTCSCHLHPMSDVMHLEAGCDTQTFELAVVQKICPSKLFRIQRYVQFARPRLAVRAMCIRCLM